MLLIIPNKYVIRAVLKGHLWKIYHSTICQLVVDIGKQGTSLRHLKYLFKHINYFGSCSFFITVLKLNVFFGKSET